MDDNEKPTRMFEPLSDEQKQRMFADHRKAEAAEAELLKQTGGRMGPCLSRGETECDDTDPTSTAEQVGPPVGTPGPKSLQSQIEAARLMGFDV